MEKFWAEHVYLIYISMIGLFILVGYLMRMMIKQGLDSMKTMTNSILNLYTKYNGLDEKVSNLIGQHDAFVKSGFHEWKGRK
jgi:hypothetical protein